MKDVKCRFLVPLTDGLTDIHKCVNSLIRAHKAERRGPDEEHEARETDRHADTLGAQVGRDGTALSAVWLSDGSQQTSVESHRCQSVASTHIQNEQLSTSLAGRLSLSLRWGFVLFF